MPGLKICSQGFSKIGSSWILDCKQQSKLTLGLYNMLVPTGYMLIEC